MNPHSACSPPHGQRHRVFVRICTRTALTPTHGRLWPQFAAQGSETRGEPAAEAAPVGTKVEVFPRHQTSEGPISFQQIQAEMQMYADSHGGALPQPDRNWVSPVPQEAARAHVPMGDYRAHLATTEKAPMPRDLCNNHIPTAGGTSANIQRSNLDLAHKLWNPGESGALRAPDFPGDHLICGKGATCAPQSHHPSELELPAWIQRTTKTASIDSDSLSHGSYHGAYRAVVPAPIPPSPCTEPPIPREGQPVEEVLHRMEHARPSRGPNSPETGSVVGPYIPMDWSQQSVTGGSPSPTPTPRAADSTGPSCVSGGEGDALDGKMLHDAMAMLLSRLRLKLHQQTDIFHPSGKVFGNRVDPEVILHEAKRFGIPITCQLARLLFAAVCTTDEERRSGFVESKTFEMRMMLTSKRDSLLEKAMQLYQADIDAPMAGSPEAQREELAHVVDLLRAKVKSISQGSGRTTGQLAGLRKAFQMLCGPDGGMSQPTLMQQLQRWGIRLSAAQGNSLFSIMAPRGQAALTLQDFEAFIYPPSPTQEPLFLQEPGRPDSHEVSKTRAVKIGARPETLVWSPVKILRAIQRKCCEKATRKADQVRIVFQMFNNPRGKVDPAGMVATLGTWGMLVTLEDVEGVFRFLDSNENREIELTEFAQGVIFPDYSEDGPIAKKEDAEREEAENRQLLERETMREQQRGGSLAPSPEAWKFHLQQLTHKIRNKLERHSTRDEDLARSAFQLFSRQGTFTKGVMRSQLHNLGFTDVTEVEVDAIFQTLDKDGTGLIDFGEFMRGIIPTEHHNTLGSGKEPTVTAKHAERLDQGIRDEAKRQGVSPDWLAWKAGQQQGARG